MATVTTKELYQTAGLVERGILDGEAAGSALRKAAAEIDRLHDAAREIFKDTAAHALHEVSPARCVIERVHERTTALLASFHGQSSGEKNGKS